MKKYATPKLEVLTFFTQDSVRTSLSTDPDKGDLENWDRTLG